MTFRHVGRTLLKVLKGIAVAQRDYCAQFMRARWLTEIGKID
jgi:hypothetical protein